MAKKLNPLHAIGASLTLRLSLVSAAFVGAVLVVLSLVARDRISATVQQQWEVELQNRLDSLLAYQDVLPITTIDPGLYGELYSGNYWERQTLSQASPAPPIEASLSLADFSLLEQLPSYPSTSRPGRKFTRLSGPLGEPLLALVETRHHGDTHAGAGVSWMLIARDATELDRLIARVRRQINLLLILIGISAVFATVLAIVLGAQPLRRLARDLAALREGRRQRVRENLPTEMAGLARTLNNVMANQESHLRRQRETAANLAHELKTPLTALQQKAELHDHVDAAFIEEKVQRMWGPLEQELARARIHGPAPGLEPTHVLTQVERAIQLCQSDHAPPPGAIQVDIPASLTLAIEARDLFTVIWNLLDNALRHGGHPIIIHARSGQLVIEDSGSQTRGTRQSSTGAGLTLVEHILDAYDGSLLVERSSLGGRRYTLVPGGRCEST